MLKAIDLLARAQARASTGRGGSNPLVAALGSLLRPRRDPTTIEQLTAYRGWIYKAINVRAARIAEIDLQVVEVQANADGTEERVPIPFHPMYEILGRGGRRRPNPLTTTDGFKRMLEIDLGLTGNHYWVKVRDATRVTERGGIPREIWRVRPDRMLPVIDLTTGLIAGWGFIPFGSGQKAVWEAPDVVHFKYPHPLDPYLGLSPIMASAHAINIDVFNHLYQQRFFEQGALATVVLSTQEDINEADAKEMLEIFKLRHTGDKSAWLPIIAGNGVQVTPITLSNRDLEAIKLFEWSLDEILSIYGVSKTQLGLAGDVNLSNAHALDVAFNKNVIKPELTLIEHQIEADLIPDYPERGEDSWLEVDFENPVPGDREFELEQDRVLVGLGGKTINEVRSARGELPFEGRYGDLVQVPFGTMLLDPTGDQIPGLDVPDEEPPDEPSEEEQALEAAWIRDVRPPTDAERTAFWHAWSARAARWEPRVAALMRNEFAREARAAIAQLRKQAKRDARAGALDIDDLVIKAIGSDADQVLREAFGDVLSRLIRREGALALKLLNEQTFDWKDVAARYLQLVENRIKGINRTTEQALRRSLAEGLRNEESMAKLARRVRATFEDASRSRSIMIARTEVIGASNFAAVAGYEQGGAKNKGWLSSRDDRVRDAHIKADGQVVPIQQAFTVGGEPLMYPGDPNGSPQNVIQCRCTVEPR